MLEDKYYSISDVARITKLTDRTIRNYLSQGTLKGQKIGGQWRFTKDDILSLFKEPSFEEDVIDQARKYLIDYYDNKFSFDSDNGSIVININLKTDEDLHELYQKLHQVEADNDLKYKISFVDDNNRKAKIVIVGSFRFIYEILDKVKEFIL